MTLMMDMANMMRIGDDVQRHCDGTKEYMIHIAGSTYAVGTGIRQLFLLLSLTVGEMKFIQAKARQKYRYGEQDHCTNRDCTKD